MTDTRPETFVCIVLDRSGSMQAVHSDAMGAVNSYIDAAKKDRALYEAKFSLITFNSRSVDMLRRNEIMETVKPLAGHEYICGDWTPLYDAIGRGIGLLDEVTAGKKDAKAVLAVMTDGQENASREFSHARITQLIKDKQEAGWMVIFLGEGLDVARQGASIGTRSGNVASYQKGAGLRNVGAVLASTNSRYFAAPAGKATMDVADAGLNEDEKKWLMGQDVDKK